ncbi:ribonuclease H-like domain-containing protein [Tanacetum coccineum]
MYSLEDISSASHIAMAIEMKNKNSGLKIEEHVKEHIVERDNKKKVKNDQGRRTVSTTISNDVIELGQVEEIQVKQEVIEAIVDTGSEKNLISSSLVERLGLETTPHPRPYSLGWKKKDVDTQVNRKPIPPTSSVTALRIPIIKKGEYDLWSMKMRQYIAITDHILWDIITNGNQTTTDPASPSVSAPKTSLAANARRNNEKALNILLSAIPDRHLLSFHDAVDARSLWKAIKARFGGNEASKKMQKNLLKQQFETFTIGSREELDSAYERFQHILSMLELHDATVSIEDANLKFLRSLPSVYFSINNKGVMNFSSLRLLLDYDEDLDLTSEVLPLDSKDIMIDAEENDCHSDQASSGSSSSRTTRSFSYRKKHSEKTVSKSLLQNAAKENKVAISSSKEIESDSTETKTSDGGIFRYLDNYEHKDADHNLITALYCYRETANCMEGDPNNSVKLHSLYKKKGWVCNELGRKRLEGKENDKAEQAFSKAINSFKKVFSSQ